MGSPHDLPTWGAGKALTVLRRLLERERGAYWTYCFFTGERYLVGASPERHVSVHGGEVRMNPISTGLARADLAETIAGRPDGYVVPKPRHAGDVRGGERLPIADWVLPVVVIGTMRKQETGNGCSSREPRAKHRPTH